MRKRWVRVGALAVSFMLASELHAKGPAWRTESLPKTTTFGQLALQPGRAARYYSGGPGFGTLARAWSVGPGLTLPEGALVAFWDSPNGAGPYRPFLAAAPAPWRVCGWDFVAPGPHSQGPLERSIEVPEDFVLVGFSQGPTPRGGQASNLVSGILGTSAVVHGLTLPAGSSLMVSCESDGAGKPVSWGGTFASEQRVSGLTLKAGQPASLDLTAAEAHVKEGTLGRTTLVLDRLLPAGTRLMFLPNDGLMAYCPQGAVTYYLAGAWSPATCGLDVPPEPSPPRAELVTRRPPRAARLTRWAVFSAAPAACLLAMAWLRARRKLRQRAELSRVTDFQRLDAAKHRTGASIRG
jgi:hypothetical protein